MDMVEHRLYPSSQTYVSMLEHLAHGGHLELLPQIWEKIADVECLTEDIKPLLLKCICDGNYDFALALIERITENTSSNKNGYNFYLERRLFNLMHYARKVNFSIFYYYGRILGRS